MEATIQEAIRYGLSLFDSPYVWWLGESILGKDSGPFWSTNSPPPTLEIIQSQGVCCTGLLNLIRRHLGLYVPGTISAHPFAGGTGCWEEFLMPHMETFDPTKDYPEGTLLFRPYKAFEDQGHIAILLEDGRLLHSYVNDPNPLTGFQSPGVTVDPTWKTSHHWLPDGYYKFVAKPEAWLCAPKID